MNQNQYPNQNSNPNSQQGLWELSKGSWNNKDSFSNNKGDNNNYKLIEHISKKDTTSALSVIESMKINDRNSVALLIWILSRDINAIKLLLDGRNIRSLGIWENQIQWYQKISSRIAPKTIEKLISKINIVDRKFKGVSKGDPWNGLKDIVLSLSA